MTTPSVRTSGRHRAAALAAFTGLLTVTALLMASPAAVALPSTSAAPASSALQAAGVAFPAAACPTVWWGSLTKSSADATDRPITQVRTGRHACYDRLVVDLGRGSGSAGYRVSYVSAVYSEGRGAPVPVAGGATIQIVVRAPSYTISTGAPTYQPADPRHLTNVTGYSSFRQLAWAGTFEGQTTIALGVRARLPMRVFTLPGAGGGQRLVIDVAHHW